MALADYRLCDVCESKAFYDSNLNYGDGTDEWYKNLSPYRQAGKDQYDKQEFNQKYGTRLDHLGDWAVVCTDCAKTHKTIVVPINVKQSEPDHREVMRQALEALEYHTEQTRPIERTSVAIQALRAALGERDE
jgi:hypothetical protein